MIVTRSVKSSLFVPFSYLLISQQEDCPYTDFTCRYISSTRNLIAYCILRTIKTKNNHAQCCFSLVLGWEVEFYYMVGHRLFHITNNVSLIHFMIITYLGKSRLLHMYLSERPSVVNGDKLPCRLAALLYCLYLGGGLPL